MVIKKVIHVITSFLEIYYDIKINQNIQTINILSKLITMKIRYLLMFFLSILIFSCGTKKSPINESNQSKIITIYKDSIREIVVNKEINDTIYVSVPLRETKDKSLDSLVNVEVQNILKNIRFTKSSGDVKVSVNYDEKTKILSIIIKVPEVKSDNQKIVKENNNTEQKNDIKYVSVPRELTRWQNLQMALGRLFILILLLYISYKFLE